MSLPADDFNNKYPIGSSFIWQPCKFLRGGLGVKTIEIAYGNKKEAVVRINNPTKSVVSINDLTPAGNVNV
ncbi:hypothetical protein CKQ84_15850 [Shewanella sp. WE21]|uniref:hypothetical protein n=1 Tax=Shewanella sp. WE21 TaxID=2029986 RepID=UPI000CF67A5F|nr:hypothetical protein [Shewanella sp. WE21]AVI67240.1 hypothetical protein CKQ84_15850 [Shewanella sp. WE21]